MKIIFGIIMMIGMVLNAWQITSKEPSRFVSLNYVGLVLFPLGAAMGFLYAYQKTHQIIYHNEKEIDVKPNTKK